MNRVDQMIAHVGNFLTATHSITQRNGLRAQTVGNSCGKQCDAEVVRETGRTI